MAGYFGVLIALVSAMTTGLLADPVMTLLVVRLLLAHYMHMPYS